MNPEFKPEKIFDLNRKRYFLNGEPDVFHCHHYTTLLTQLAEDAKAFYGPEILFSAAEEAFYIALEKYFQSHHITSEQDRKEISEQYFSYIGLGLIEIDIHGKVEIKHSHLDEGWIKKWGLWDKPVNYISQGFIAAAFSAITGNKPGTFKIQEIRSIVCGAQTSKFTVEKTLEN